jgi:hypothetical protein
MISWGPAVCAVVLASILCHGFVAAAATQPTTAPGPQTFHDSTGCLQVVYPGNWTVKNDPNYELTIVSGQETITVDVPDLPPHVPGMIPLGMVVNGYISDLKKLHPALNSQKHFASVPHAKAALVDSSWTEQNACSDESALLMVHGNHVFIIRVVAPASDFTAGRAVFGDVVKSIHWLK